MLILEDEKLLLKNANYDADELMLNGVEAFETKIGILVSFFRLKGVIKGFELDAGRVTNLKFIKK